MNNRLLKIRSFLFEEPRIVRESITANVRRIFYAAIVAVAVHLAHIAIFLFTVVAHSSTEHAWRLGIILAHSAMLVLMVGSILASYTLRKKEWIRTARVFQYIVVAALLAAGVAITYIDQLVTSNITPFLVVCFITATIFLLRPFDAILLFLLSFAAFFVLMGFTPQPQSVVLSNRVNGITAAGIGITLSIIMWRYFRINLMQKWHIHSQQQELEKLAFFDHLTGLPNRRNFDAILAREVSLAARQQRQSSLIILDIDYFKEVNDRFGHPCGDEVLARFAGLFRANLRACDTLCRIGGEEFAILLPLTSAARAVTVAEKLRKCLERHSFSAGPGSAVRLTASFGITPLIGEDTLPAAYYAQADDALYHAKQDGRNCVRVYRP